MTNKERKQERERKKEITNEKKRKKERLKSVWKDCVVFGHFFPVALQGHHISLLMHARNAVKFKQTTVSLIAGRGE